MSYKNQCVFTENEIVVSLTQNKTMVCDNNEKTKYLLKHNRWCVQKSKTGFYAVTNIRIQMTGEKPKYKRFYFHALYLDISDLDHQDRNGLNNLKANLRKVSRSHQAFNQKMKSNNTSGYRGIREQTDRYITTKDKIISYTFWEARITKGKKYNRNFTFKTPAEKDSKLQEAIQWRKQKEIELYGENLD